MFVTANLSPSFLYSNPVSFLNYTFIDFFQEIPGLIDAAFLEGN